MKFPTTEILHHGRDSAAFPSLALFVAEIDLLATHQNANIPTTQATHSNQ